MSLLPHAEPSRKPGVLTQFPTQKRTDASLVASAAAGDREAFAAIWDRYSGLVRGVVFGALGPDSMIEDIVQDVFLALVRGAKNIKDGSALRGYLAKMAVHQAAMEIRRRRVRRLVGLSPTGELPERAAAPADAESRQAVSALLRVLSQLSERRKMAFVLRHVHGLDMLEVAGALGISESTLRRELHAARSFIKRAAPREAALADRLAQAEGAWS